MRAWAKRMSGAEAVQAEGTASGKVLRQERTESSVAEVVWGSGAGRGQLQRGSVLCCARFTRQSSVHPGRPWTSQERAACIIADARHTPWPMRNTPYPANSLKGQPQPVGLELVLLSHRSGVRCDEPCGHQRAPHPSFSLVSVKWGQSPTHCFP